jgi:serine protease inhibitor
MTRFESVRFVALLALLPLAACSETTGPAGGADPITTLPRALTDQEIEVVARTAEFGLELVREVVARDERPNVILSPLSASMALGMTLNGAAGTTFEAMRGTLGFDQLSQADINEAYRGLIALLTSLDPAVEISLANSVWANQDVDFRTSFMDAVQDAFHAQVESRDFTDPATLAAVNAWVDEQTLGRIPTILSDLDPDLVMLLINAVAFDARWSTAFDPADTRRQTFTRGDGSTVQVDMMTSDELEIPLGGGIDYQAAELPYGGGPFGMVVIVPQGPGTVADFVAGLDVARFDQILGGLAPRKVDLLALPRFTLRYDALLNDALGAMGMVEAFYPGADFSNLADGPLCIDFVRQKTFIEVDEAGTKAAAATAVGIGPTSFNGLIADRPFVLAIRERLTGTLLFAGVVGDPTFEDSGPAQGEGHCH